MNADNGMSTPHHQQLRALLFTDLCDSLLLVASIGDIAAAELFQQHDRLVLALQQRWHGRLIDRSDGLLLLFERAIDGLGFALDYRRGLQQIGEQRQMALRARAGLHVGNVLTWENSPEAVKFGAKSLEVEGLAKPIAARLMALARPGQILLSAQAEALTRLAAAELGQRGQHLLWKSHGRWRFKGMPSTQEVHEVGEIGFAPLRMPRANAKARRDVPVWRQPAALAAEVVVLALLLAGGWMLLRPVPAIAFAERDWVVIGDMRNLTGNTLFDDSLQQALRISLEQSRYVNVLSDLKVRSTLRLMRRAPDAGLDAATASEVALRAGARMVLMPTVAEVGGRTRFSIEVLQPQSQQTLAIATADSSSERALLASIDQVTATLRGKLGEGMPQLRTDSTPLPQATTASLDALRAYAIGQKLYAAGDFAGALAMYQQAVRLDDDFALAWLGQVRARFASVDNAGALEVLQRVRQLSPRLSPREMLYADAWEAALTEPARAADAWVRLASLYPDYFAAQHNAAQWLYVDNRFQEALPHALKAADARFELSTVAYDQLGRIRLALGDPVGARRALETAVAGGRDISQRYLAAVAASQHDVAGAARLLEKVRDDPYTDIERCSFAADQGQWQSAIAAARSGLQRMSSKPGYDTRLYLLPLATAQWAGGEPDNALRSVRRAMAAVETQLSRAGGVDAADDSMLALGAALLALRMGDTATAERALAMVRAGPPALKTPALNEMILVVAAELKRTGGDPAGALQLLEPRLGDGARIQTRVVAMKAYQDLHRRGDALRQAHLLGQSRGQAYAEVNCGYCMQVLNVVDGNAAERWAAQPPPAAQGSRTQQLRGLSVP